MTIAVIILGIASIGAAFLVEKYGRKWSSTIWPGTLMVAGWSILMLGLGGLVLPC